MAIDQVKVFSATKAQDRITLGEEVTKWLQKNPHKRVVEQVVKQSSDSAYHCISIVLFLENAPIR